MKLHPQRKGLTGHLPVNISFLDFLVRIIISNLKRSLMVRDSTDTVMHPVLFFIRKGYKRRSGILVILIGGEKVCVH
jgi:hypothetical protein